MVIRLKDGVSLEHLTPQAVLGMFVTAGVLEWFHSDLTITSVDDGKHGVKSLHGKGRAFDFRIWNIEEKYREDCIDLLRKELGSEFDVVLEPTHGHVEWDPDYLKRDIV